MKNVNWKELFIDILVDIVAGMIIAVGIYNFALNADFPVAGFSGIAIILYHIFGFPCKFSHIPIIGTPPKFTAFPNP